MKEYSADAGTTLLPEVNPASYAPDAQPLPFASAEAFAHIPLAQLVASLTNPRTTFNAAKLQELADSIRTSGVHQPILVRPLPGGRVLDTDRHVQYEIVAGERRFRACQLAGLAAIPAMVRAMLDGDVLEVQIVENLQRDDLSELEESEGYERLMQHSSLSADQVAAKIGKSRSYVYARLKLIELCFEARTSLRDGTIDASRALLVARIPDHKLQIKALKEIIDGVGYYHSGREPMSHRQAADHVQSNYMLKLSSAAFDTADAELVPAAGSCKTCPKRTGHDPDLFSDVKGADVCIDPPCFTKKQDAHALNLVNVAKSKGQTVISGREAQELVTQGYSEKFKGYRRLDVAEDSPTDQPLRKIIGKQMEAESISPVMIESQKTKGELVAALTNEVALRLLKTVEGQALAAKTVAKEVREFANEKKAKADSKAKAQFEQDWRNQLMERTWQALNEGGDIGFTMAVHRYLALKTATSLSTDQSAAMCRLLDLGKIAPHDALITFAKTTTNPDELQLLMVMLRDCDANDYGHSGRIANEGLHLVAGVVFKEGLPKVIELIKTASLAKYFPDVKVKKAPAPTAPLAQPALSPDADASPKKALAKPAPLRKPRLSAKDAQSGIAEAMQGIEAGQVPCPVAPMAGSAPVPEEGQQVKKDEPIQGTLPVGVIGLGSRVKVLNNVSNRYTKWIGSTGTVTKKMGDQAWDVTFRGRNGGLASFDATELEWVA